MSTSKRADPEYPRVDINDTFIGKIIKDYDDRFQDIQVYGKINDPYFHINDVYKYLFGLNTIDKSKDNINWFRKQFDSDEKNKKMVNVNARKGAKDQTKFEVRECTLLNKAGMYRAAYFTHNNLVSGAKAFQKFVLIVLNQLESTGSTTLAQATDDLKKEMDVLKAKLIQEHDRADELDRSKFMTECNLRDAVQGRDFQGRPEDVGDNERKMCMLLCKEYLKPIGVYVVDPAYVENVRSKKQGNRRKTIRNKTIREELKANGMSDDSDDSDDYLTAKSDTISLDLDYSKDVAPTKYGGVLEYDLLSVNEYTLKSDENEDYYFYIAPNGSKMLSTARTNKKVYKHVFDIYINNKEHYTYMLELLNDEDYKTRISDVYVSSYSNIVEVSKQSYITLAVRKEREAAKTTKKTLAAVKDVK
jgi:hypothetical protein